MLSSAKIYHGGSTSKRSFLGSGGGGSPISDDYIINLINQNTNAFSRLFRNTVNPDQVDKSLSFFNGVNWSFVAGSEYQCISESPSINLFHEGLNDYFDMVFLINGFGSNANGLGLRFASNTGTVYNTIYFKNGFVNVGGVNYVNAYSQNYFRIQCFYDTYYGFEMAVYTLDTSTPIPRWRYLASDAFAYILDTITVSTVNSLGCKFTVPIIECNNPYINDIPKASREQTLVDAATVAVNAKLGNIFSVTLGGNRILGNPTGALKNQLLQFRIKQDATGNRLLTFDTKYRFSSDLPIPVLSTGANKIDYLGFIYNRADDKFDYISEVKGF